MQSHGPKIAQGGIVADFDAASVKSYPNGNILGWGSWLNLSSSYQPVDTNVTYQLNQTTSGENARLYDIDPWGNSNVVWQSYPSGDGNADGGWTTTAFPVDPTKLYRFSIWARRVSSTTGGNFYFGCYGDVGMGQVGSPGTNNGNPYWECFGIGGFGVQYQWYLIVGHIFPVSYTGSTAHPDTGWYLPNNAVKLQNIGGCNIGVDCQWLPGTSYGYHRVYHYYCGDNTSHLQFFQPRVEIIDGITNPTIADLVNNAGSTWYDRGNNYNVLKPSNWNYSTLGKGSFANTTSSGSSNGMSIPLTPTINVNYLAVGGGGSGASGMGGGGGGGGVITGNIRLQTGVPYTVVVGGGGASIQSWNGSWYPSNGANGSDTGLVGPGFITNGLIARYNGTSVSGTTWCDIISNGQYNATFSSAPTLVSGISNGAGNYFPAVRISNSITCTFPSGILPSTYTLFHVCRYQTSGNHGRILSGKNTNWLSGFWNGYQGVAYHNGWLTNPFNTAFGTNWGISTDQNSLYRGNGVNYTTGGPGSPTYDQLQINYSESSDCDIADIFVYNRTLTTAEILQMEAYLAQLYGISITVSAPTLIDAVGGGGGGCGEYHGTQISQDGQSGGSGGGGGGYWSSSTYGSTGPTYGGASTQYQTSPIGGFNYGNSGGNSGNASAAGGGGGGATGAGGSVASNNYNTAGGGGGAGYTWPTTGNTYGGGGGGCATYSNAGSGGSGGGGSGSTYNSNGGAGTANTGGGGGGARNISATSGVYSGAGGSGIMIISSPIAATATTGSPAVTTSGNNYLYTFNSSGSITLGTTSSVANFPKQSGTLEIWAYPTSWYGSNGLFMNRSDSIQNAEDWFWFGVWSDGGYLYFRTGDGFGCCNNDMSLSGWSGYHALNTWGHYVVTWTNNGGAYVYFNGTAVMSRTVGYIPPTNPSVTGTIGTGHPAGNCNWLGNIAVTRIYNRPLSQDEVIQNFNAQRRRFGL